MKTALTLKFNENLGDLNNAQTEKDKDFHYAYLKGFLSAVFEMPVFSQAEYDELCIALDKAMFGSSLNAC
jgi:hypothetical protein